MIQINLLPHREIRRRMRQKMFIAMTISAVVLGIVIVIMGLLIFNKQLENQLARNEFLKKENAVLDGKIEQIKRLKEETDALLHRKEAIEKLQSNRTETVHMLDEIVRQMPDGVYLKSIRQSGKKVLFEGFAQSNARVSTLMENLDRSPWFASPELVESKQISLNGVRLHEFSLDMQLKYDASQDAQKQQTSDLVSVPSGKGLPSSNQQGKNAAGLGEIKQEMKASSSVPVGMSDSPKAQGKSETTPTVSPAPPHASISPAVRPTTILGLPTPQSVTAKVNDALSKGQKRSMP